MTPTARLPQGENRRTGPRKAVRLAAKLVCGDDTRLVQTWDLGRGGICVLSPRPIAPGTRCRVAFDLPLDGARFDIDVAAKVVYSSVSATGEFKIGAVFVDVADAAASILDKFVAAA